MPITMLTFAEVALLPDGQFVETHTHHGRHLDRITAKHSDGTIEFIYIFDLDDPSAKRANARWAYSARTMNKYLNAPSSVVRALSENEVDIELL